MKVGRSRGTEGGDGGRSADQVQSQVNPMDIHDQPRL